MAGTEEETESVWWAAPKFVMSAVAVILLVIAGIILFVVVGNDEQSTAAPPAQPSAASPSTSNTPTTSEESVCGLDATGGTTLTAAPADVEWEFLGGIAAPKSAKHGPGVVDEQTGVRSCYSHTPEGALLALAGLMASSGDGELLLETTKALSLDGPGKNLGIQQIEGRLASNDGGGPPLKVEAFRLLSYNDAEATVEVVFSGDSGSDLIYFTSSAVLEWHQGDWYVRYEDDGSSGPVEGQVSDLSGYVPWGPISG